MFSSLVWIRQFSINFIMCILWDFCFKLNYTNFTPTSILHMRSNFSDIRFDTGFVIPHVSLFWEWRWYKSNKDKMTQRLLQLQFAPAISIFAKIIDTIWVRLAQVFSFSYLFEKRLPQCWLFNSNFKSDFLF